MLRHMRVPSKRLIGPPRTRHAATYDYVPILAGETGVGDDRPRRREMEIALGVAPVGRGPRRARGGSHSRVPARPCRDRKDQRPGSRWRLTP
jgi:hypothetical protein